MRPWLHKAMFTPPWWAVFINPHFLPRRALHEAMRTSAPMLKGRVLDIGCGTQPYRALLNQAHEVVGLEIESADAAPDKRADVYYDGTTFPFPAESFSSALCNQVLEHVFDPSRFLAEANRVLEPGGTLVLSVPFVWPEHEAPADSQRYTSYGLIHQFRIAGFDVIQHSKLVCGGATVCALLADRLNRRFTRLPLAFRLMLRAMLIAPVSVLGCISNSNEDELFLDNFVIARKTTRVVPK